jgi:phospholipid-transporting ATPase
LFTSPLDPFSTVMTLAFVLMVTCIKEGYEDLQRYRSDTEENTRLVTVVRWGENGVAQELEVETQSVKAGDIIKMTGTTQVPVDLLLMLTSNYADGNQCYVETANIDGETNLKLREAPAGLKQMTQDGSLLADGNLDRKLFNGTMEFEQPNKDIHNFIGALHLSDVSEPIPLSAQNILLRSSLFSNTDWAYGIAVYTGQETKIQMNNKRAPSKLSKLEGYLNLAIIIIFFCQIALVTASVISIYGLGFEDFDKLPYVYANGSGTGSILPLWLEQWFVFFLLYNNFIPISLYVTIELVNLGQGFLIGSDLEMYEPSLDVPCVVRSSNLAQELGQVSNIFSDKTGTLTRNEMKFVKFVVDDHLMDIPWDSEPSESMKSKLASPTQGKKLVNFLRCMTVCHTVVREKDGTYRAESPDELALIEGVGRFDCNLVERGTSAISVNVLGQRKTYEILAVNAFNSDRKRMSILVRDAEAGEHLLFCKGADNIMMPLCNMTQAQVQAADKSLLDLANLGLRTLCIAQKKLSSDAAWAWMSSYRAAASSLTDRAEKLAAAGAELEQGMEFLGLTAIEDRLQDEVPEVIADLAVAGIIVWMLTGDKEETAVNIGRSCNLVLPETKLLNLTKTRDAEEYNTRLKNIYDDVEANSHTSLGYVENGVTKSIVFVMDGPSFRFLDENNKDQRKWFLRIGKACRAVIGCRLTPIQKQTVVHIVKKDTVPRAITLSIGDGANDVSMIREADVGVGIFGKEGRQAANNADFAIGQFKFLRRLLLVHGRWNYIRQSRVFLYSMHKNMVITLTLFWYSFYTAVSGTSLYESWIYTAFNFILGLPIIFYGMQDRDISAEFALAHPQVPKFDLLTICVPVFTILKCRLTSRVVPILI